MINEEYFLNIYINHFNHVSKHIRLNNVVKGREFDEDEFTKGIDKKLKPRGKCYRRMIILEYG